jgi:hypothetical protein
VRLLLADVHAATLQIVDNTSLADLIGKVSDPEGSIAALGLYIGADI